MNKLSRKSLFNPSGTETVGPKVASTRSAVSKKGKRKVLNDQGEPIRVKKRRKMQESSSSGEGSNNIDRISGLPEPIIHHILSFLRFPEDLARTSVLSKSWRSMWASFHSFDFDQKGFRSEGLELHEQFKNFVQTSLSTRLSPLVAVQKFRLKMTSYGVRLLDCLDGWLSDVISKKVEDVELHLKVYKRRRWYTLPQIVLTAETLTSLKIYGCKLNYESKVNLPNLRQLSIKETTVNDVILKTFMQGCPRIEDLRLIYCRGLMNLYISGPDKLERVEVHECPGLVLVEIKLQSLRTFWYCGKRNMSCMFSLEDCKNLKNLTLMSSTITDEQFRVLIEKFQFLEELVLNRCYLLEKISIFGGMLKRIAVALCGNLSEAMISAPNLHAMEYKGAKFPFPSPVIPNLREVKLYLESTEKFVSRSSRIVHIPSWFTRLQEFLNQVDPSKGLKLVMRHNKDVIVSEELRDMKLLPFRSSLKLEIVNSSKKLNDLVSSLLRTTHPEKILVSSPPKSKFLEFLREKFANRDENPGCCTYYSKKCWSHYLKDVKIENEWTSNNIPCQKSPSTPNQITSFKLEWKDEKNLEA